MSTIIPAPPGEAVGIADAPPAPLAAPSTSNLFAVGVLDEGSVAQVSTVARLRSAFGARSSGSVASDEIATALAEGAGPATVARVTGPAALGASLTLDAKLKFTATDVGAWGNDLEGELFAPDAGTRQLVVTRDGKPFATSPVWATQADILPWNADGRLKVSTLAAGVPAASASAPFGGGTDDRASISVESYRSAFAKLARKFGPGHLLICGVTDITVHGAAIEHLAATNRIGYASLPAAVTEAEAQAHHEALAAAYPADCWRLSLWGEWAYTVPVASEPERLVCWSALQAGISSRVEQANGYGAAPFGIRRGQSLTATRLHRNWSSGHTPPGEIQRLYASYVNTAYDNGRGAIYSKGYRSCDPAREDFHTSGTRMRLAWMAEQEAEQVGGENTDMSTVGSYVAALSYRCQTEFADRGAFNRDDGPGFRVLGDDPINDPDSLGRREVHAVIRWRPNGSVHWTDTLVGSVATTEQL